MRAVRQGAGFPRAAALVAVGLTLVGCNAGPDYQRPALAPGAGVSAQALGGDAADVTPGSGKPHLHSGADIPQQWWEVFHCADLDALVRQALEQNPTVTAAQAALRGAHEALLAQHGGSYPAVAASIAPSRQKVASTLASPLANNEDLFNLTTTQVSISYSPDLFGANARTIESLVAEEDLQRYQLAAARLSLASNVVLAAIQDAMLREQITSTQVIIVEQQRLVASFARLHDLGQASQAEVATQQTQLAQVEATLPTLEKQFLINRDLLAALVGRTPGEPLAVTFTVQGLILPTELPVSLPARLVEQRPDVLIAEAQLRAASAQVGIAEAARWPNLQLSATLGSAALSLYPSFSTPTHFFDIAASLTQPLFDAGTLRHRERVAEAAYAQAAAQYQATVIGAFQNTSDVLHALWLDGEELRDTQRSQRLAGSSLAIAQAQQALGDVTEQAVLSAEQSVIQTSLGLLQARATLDGDVVALYQALGGGWWHQAPAP